MTAILKVDTIQDTSGNNIINESSDTITIGASGDTTNIIGTLQNNGAGVGSSDAFHAYDMSSNASGTLVLTSELLDDGSNYNTSMEDTQHLVLENIIFIVQVFLLQVQILI